MIRTVLFCCFLSFVSESLAENIPALEQQLIGRTISKVTFRSPLDKPQSDYQGIFTLPDVIEPGEIVSAFEQLRSKDLFEHIDLVVIEHADGIELQFLLIPKIVIAELKFAGNDSLKIAELKRAAKLRRGSVFNLEDLVASKQRVVSAYAKIGFDAAKVGVQVIPTRPPFMDLEFNIDEGQPRVVTAIEILGELPPKLSNLHEILRQEFEGEAASESFKKALRLRILSLMRREGYWEATVTLPEFIDKDGEIVARIDAKPGEALSLSIQGSSEFPQEELLAPLQLDTRSVALSPYAVRRLSKRIKKLYESEGFLDARVQYREEEARSYVIEIKEGKPYYISSIEFRGNYTFEDGELIEFISGRPGGFFLFRQMEVADPNKLEADISFIANHYIENGLVDVELGLSLERDTENQTVDVLIEVTEGERRLFSKAELRWEGEEVKDITLDLKPGEPIEKVRISKQKDRIQEALFARGYPNSTIEVKFENAESAIEFTVQPGPLVTFGDTVIQGNYATSDQVIRDLLTYEKGDIWTPQRLRELEQNLYRLGFFQSVHAVALDGYADSLDEVVAITVIERETGSLEVGAAFHTEDGLELRSELGQRNLYGSGNSLVLGVDVFFKNGDRNRIFDAGIVRAVHKVPRVLGTDMDLNSSVYAQYSVQLIDQYSFDRVGGVLALDIPLAESLEAQVGFRLYQEDLFDVEPAAIIGEDDEGEAFYSPVFLKLKYDTRDNVFDPRSGGKSELGVELSTDNLAADVSYLHAFAKQSMFIPLNSFFILALNGEARVYEPIADTDVIPISSREFLGGRYSLRGFQLNAVGPEAEDGTVVGGDRSLLLNVETQFLLSESAVFLFFLDAGQAFLINEGSFEGDTLGISDLSYSPGLGLRYRTPIGPFSLEYGFKSRQGGNLEKGRLNLGLGASF